VFDNNGTPANLADDILIVTYLYGGTNRRFRKTTTSSAAQGVSQIDFYYHGWQVCEEHDTSTGDSITQQYVYGLYIDEPITLDDRRGGISVGDLNDGSEQDRLFYHQNTQFTVHGLTDENGVLVEGYMVDPYGRHYTFTDGDSDGVVEFDGSDVVLDAGVSSANNPYFYTGRRFDVETAWFYFRNRYYSPLRGRFVSRDSMGYVDGMNLYHGYFVVNGLDPYGKSIVIPALVAAFAACVAAQAPSAVNAAESKFTSDKGKHCYVSCVIGKTCTLYASGITGAGWEVFQYAMTLLGVSGYDASWEDMLANSIGLGCSGGFIPLFGHFTTWCGLTPTCEDCCKSHYN